MCEVVIGILCLVSLELVAEKIEDPFRKDENDLPMQKNG
jgi:predicted membrane chloride channel (bestrophin family)